MKDIVILDYGLGNLFSVQQACREVGMKVTVSSDPVKLLKADAAILPGVGAFGHAMEELEKRNLKVPLLEFTKLEKPLLGICLGMQLLLDESEEFGKHTGLGLIPGKVKKFPSEINNHPVRIPHMGWNDIKNSYKNHPALQNIPDGSNFYFVHSYFVSLDDQKYELTSTEYEGMKFTSSIVHGNIWAFQFHPEKSGTIGLQLYKNWALNFGL